MKKLAVACIAVVVALVLAAPVFAQSQPSAKATASFADVHLLVGSSTTPDNPDADTSGWTTILGNTIKTSNQKDLFIAVSIECGIFTDTLVRSSGGITDTSLASGGVRIRVVVDPATANSGSAPGASGFYASPGGGHDVDVDGNFTDVANGQGVSFCKRIQQLSAKLQGIIENLACFPGGIFDPDAPGCSLTDEEIRLVLATLDANAFNFIAENLSTGVHLVEVQAKLDTSAVAQKGSASAKAFVGMGSVTVEEVRMIKNEVITF